MMTVDSTVIATPVNAKVLPPPSFPLDEAMSEEENRILRSSDALNKQQQPHAENRSLPPEAAPEAGNEKRKGDARKVSIGGEQENNGQNAGRKRSLPAEREVRLKRKSTEPPPQVKNLVRSTASSRAAAAATHKAAPSSRVAKQQPGGNKTRGWVR